jgi:hypothetical protein
MDNYNESIDHHPSLELDNETIGILAIQYIFNFASYPNLSGIAYTFITATKNKITVI